MNSLNLPKFCARPVFFPLRPTVLAARLCDLLTRNSSCLKKKKNKGKTCGDSCVNTLAFYDGIFELLPIYDIEQRNTSF